MIHTKKYETRRLDCRNFLAVFLFSDSKLFLNKSVLHATVVQIKYAAMDIVIQLEVHALRVQDKWVIKRAHAQINAESAVYLEYIIYLFLFNLVGLA